MPKVTVARELSGKILDIGGGGEGILGRVYGPAVTAIDLYEEELREAPEGFEKLVMDARCMTFANAGFDAVTAFYSFMYIPREDHARVAGEIFRVLRPGGTFLLWDAEIETADPFLVELEIDAAGQQVHTTYGVYKKDAAQNAAWFQAVFCAVGFVPLASCVHEGQIFQTWGKPV